MRVYLQQIKHYFLTVDTNGVRKKHMMEEFKDYDINEVNPVIGIEREKSICSGFCRMLDLGLRNQERGLPFQPFIVYEDDCSKFREFPEYVEIPDNADILYVGLSRYSMNNTSHHLQNYFENIDNEVISIKNMLSAHGIMVCSASGAHALQKAALEGYYKNKQHDIFYAYLHTCYNVYALKKPLVYQDRHYGGCEQVTKFSIISNVDCKLPEDYINITNDSIIMSYPTNKI